MAEQHRSGIPRLIGIMGPTASGKTELAESIAHELDAQLINADAFQIYQGMDIGTAKPSNKSSYRLLDIRKPSESFGVGEYVLLAQAVLRDCWERGRNVVLVGGTGLYVRALFEEYTDMAPAPDPELRRKLDERTLEDLVSELRRVAPDESSRVDLKNRVRVQRTIERLSHWKPSVPVNLPPFEKTKLAVVREPSDTSDRITRRVVEMVHNGWVQEVRDLRDNGYTLSDPGMRALGYRAIWEHLAGEIEIEEAVATTIADTRRYAKRQRTWLRSEPKLVTFEGVDALNQASNYVLFDSCRK
ncbi:MAG: tRNA (adenosine(37)-N6)-dimethylallyltransferase MiaA [Fimbriimonas sp.]|nr:tRNA (adenosine(37)-N6)-dimethylallyltransferase MiaA [Fimbriimonas sp.]